MITPSMIYWLTRLNQVRYLADNLGRLGCLVTAIGIALAGGLYIMAIFTGNHSYDLFSGKTDDELEAIHQAMRKHAKNSFRIGLAGLLASIFMQLAAAFTPTAKEWAAIIVVPKVANSESVQQLGDGIVDLAKQWLAELAPKKAREQ